MVVHKLFHIMTKREMSRKNPYLTLIDNTGTKTIYHGRTIEEHITKFEVLIIPTGVQYQCERKRDYMGKLQWNRLDGAALHGCDNYGLIPGGKIEIFWYCPSEAEEEEDYEKNFITGDLRFPIYVILPSEVREAMLRRGLYDQDQENYL
jgi:hypothetical protein